MPVPPHSLFSSFPTVSFEAWEAKVAAELRGKSFESLFFQIEPGLSASPYIHPERFSGEAAGPIKQEEPGNSWKITEKITADTPLMANKIALEALNGGAEALIIAPPSVWKAQDWVVFMEGIFPEMIQLQGVFNGEAPDQHLAVQAFHQFLSDKYNTQRLDISLAVDAPAWLHADMADKLKACCDSMSQYGSGKCLLLTADAGKTPVSRLATLLSQAKNITEQLEAQGMQAKDILPLFHFHWPLGHDFFKEIATIRAWHLLWANFLQAYQVAPRQASLTAFQHESTLKQDMYQNMIAASTQSMAAVIGGVQNLWVVPADNKENPEGNTFSRRIARNLQHILRLEARLDKVTDPAAGSRFIEQLTLMIAREAWEAFRASIS